MATFLSVEITDLMMALMGYLFGSVPFGLLLTSYFAKINIRTVGSGNIGATNVLRTGRKGLAVLTLITDGSKGAVAVVLAVHIADYQLPGLVGFAAVCGHCFPIWLKGRGGKGVATGMASLAALFWPAGLLCAASWLVLAALFRVSSLAALGSFIISIAAVWTVFSAQLMPSTPFWMSLIAAVIIIRHHSNIQRLMNGTETKISFSRKDS